MTFARWTALAWLTMIALGATSAHAQTSAVREAPPPGEASETPRASDDAPVDAVPDEPLRRVGQVTAWQQVPEALHATYRRQRMRFATITLASGSGAVVGGLLDISGAVNLDGTDGAVFGALLLGGGLGTVAVGTLGLLRPVSDAELVAAQLMDEGADDATIRAWVQQRREISRRTRISRAAVLAGTGFGVLLSSALLRTSDEPSNVVGYDALTNSGVNLGRARAVLGVIGGAHVVTALVIGLRQGPEDRVTRRLEPDEAGRRPARWSLTGTGVAVVW